MIPRKDKDKFGFTQQDDRKLRKSDKFMSGELSGGEHVKRLEG